MTSELALSPKRVDGHNKLLDYILNQIGAIPTSSEKPHAQPVERARAVGNAATINAALTSGALALPPGPIGWLTVLPDVVAIWKIQAQMVADVAAAHGKTHLLTRENMLYCLFRHSATPAVRELVVQVGERFLVRRVSTKFIQRVVEKIGVRLSQKLIGEAVSRWLPIVGAIGVGAFAYYDTAEVARTATQLFEHEISIEPEPPSHVSLKAVNGMYVSSDFDRQAILIADRPANLLWERFKMIPVDHNARTVGLLSATQSWWCCDGDRGHQVLANREKLDLWETFKIEPAGPGAISLRAYNGFLLQADSTRGFTLWGDREAAGPATVFAVEQLNDADE